MRAQEKGIRIALASARPAPGLFKERDALSLTKFGGILMSYNGGRIVEAATGKVLFETSMDLEETREVLRQLEACKAGDITLEELNAAKEAILSSLRATHDSPGAIEGYYATGALSGMSMTPAQYMEKVEQVTLQQVVEAANTVKLHSSFFLKGVSA